MQFHFSKVQKHIICIFKNGKKSIFAPEKSPKIAFLVVLKFFHVQKLIFCHFWNCKKCVVVLLKLHFFSNFRALCNDAKTALFELVSILIPTYFDVSTVETHQFNEFYFLHTYVHIFVFQIWMCKFKHSIKF